MEHLDLGDVEVTYELRGDGEPIVFLHASAFVPLYRPLIAQQLPGFTTLWYRRRIAGDGAGGFRPFTLAEDAAICVRLIGHVGLPAVHVVGHSYGALVALQLAVDAPERVATLALLEPAARAVANTEEVINAHLAIVATYQRGDWRSAMDQFMRHVFGDEYRRVLDAAVPEAFDEAVGEADLFFQAELGALRCWEFGATDASGIEQPVLNVLGQRSPPRFVASSEVLQSWCPHAERLSVPDAGHLMTVQNPRTLAEGLSGFLQRARSSSPRT
jgi:pimeloyl-ACP methyl ester carboxylesterase